MLIIVKQPSFKARSNSWKEKFFSAGLFSQSLGFFLKYVSKICFDSKCKWASLSNLIFKLTKEHRNKSSSFMCRRFHDWMSEESSGRSGREGGLVIKNPEFESTVVLMFLSKNMIFF